MAKPAHDLWNYTWNDPRRYVCPEYMKHPIMRHVRFKCVRDKMLESCVAIHMSLIDIVDSYEEMLEPELLRIPLFVSFRSSLYWPEDVIREVKNRKNSSYAIFHRYFGSGEGLIVWFQGRFVAPFFQIDQFQPQLRYPHNPDLNPGLFEEYSLLHQPYFTKEKDWISHAQIAIESNRPVWKWRRWVNEIRFHYQLWEFRRMKNKIDEILEEAKEVRKS